MTDPDLWDQLSEIVRDMSSAEGLSHTLDSAVAGALLVMKNADHAAVSLVHEGVPIDTPAATDDIARRGDQLQYEVGDGPCLQAIRAQETVMSDDLREESRWPDWSRRASDELGVRSMLCLQLFVTHDNLGALNLYSDQPNAFDADDRGDGPRARGPHRRRAVVGAGVRQGDRVPSELTRRRCRDRPGSGCAHAPVRPHVGRGLHGACQGVTAAGQHAPASGRGADPERR